jgi:hypothetical protein
MTDTSWDVSKWIIDMTCNTPRRSRWYILRWQGLFAVLASMVGMLNLQSSSASLLCQFPVPVPSYQALYALYNSTNGNKWTWAQREIVGAQWNFSGVTSDEEGAARPCRDHWQGLVCVENAANLCDITSIELEYYNMQGQLPAELANLTALQILDLIENPLTGTIPSELGLVTTMTAIAFYSNQLSGTISTELGRLSNLIEFTLAYSFISGSMPSELLSLSTMSILFVESSLMTGTISPLLSNAQGLSELTIEYSFFTGPIFPCISYDNSLLTTFAIANNFFSGTMVTSIGSLSKLPEFFVNNNILSGSLPSQMGELMLMQYILLDFNHFTGVLPSELGSLVSMLSIDTENNMLSGTLATELAQLVNVQQLNFAHNAISGPIPTQLGVLTALNSLIVNNNLLSGPLVANVSSMVQLREMIVSANLMTSTLPSQLSSADFESLVCANNFFSGSFVSSFSSGFYSLQVNSNMLSGNLAIFSPENATEVWPSLIILDVSDNAFTGSFPASIFGLPSLEALVGASNCFSGVVQCSSGDDNGIAAPLFVVDMSGLSSGTACRNYLISRSVLPDSGYYPNNYMEGSIPSCLWELGNLSSLFLDGNGFEGSIAQSAQAFRAQQLVNLSLASNKLTGRIPEFILQHDGFQNLDLSSNRLFGNIDGLAICSTAQDIDVSTNRLSGSLKLKDSCDWGNLSSNVLDGNMFVYAANKLNNVEYTEALSFRGSFTLDVAIIFAASLFVSVFLLWLRRPALPSILREWDRGWRELPLSSESMFYLACLNSVSVTMVTVAFGVIVCFGLFYALLKVLSTAVGTYVNQYTWLMSAAYLHGATPVAVIAVMLVTWFLLESICVVRQLRGRAQMLSLESIPESASKSEMVAGPTYVHICAAGVRVVAVFVINIAVIGLVNTGYLIEVLNNNPHIQIIQIALSLFKVTWNWVYINGSLKWLKQSWSSAGMEKGSHSVLFRYWIKMFNFVVVPCFATAIISDSCFLKLFQQQAAPAVYLLRCESTNVSYVCEQSFVDQNSEPTLDPPFIYSFQCSSAVITNYVPVLLYACVISGLLIPGLMVLYMAAADSSSHSFGYKCARLVSRHVPHLLRPRLQGDDRDNETATIVPGKKDVDLPYDSLLGTELVNVTLLCTFGFAFPYLAAAILCGAGLELWAWLLAIGRYQRSPRYRADGAESIVREVAIALSVTAQLGLQDMLNIIIVTFVFWGGIFFDMIGDVYSSKLAVIVMCTVIFGGTAVSVGGIYWISRYIIIPDPIVGEAAGKPAKRRIDDRFSLTSNNSSFAAFNSEFKESLLM